jgi:hypothetical protein
VRFVLPEGRCISLHGTLTPNLHWLEPGLSALREQPGPWYVALAAPPYFTQGERDRLLAALLAPMSFGRVDAAILCATARALACAVGLNECITIAVHPVVSCLRIIGGGAPVTLEEDRVRPIAGREARELALSVRCLMKGQPRSLVPTLLENVVIGGDREEIERIGRDAIRHELVRVGARCVFAAEPYRIASGAQAIALALPPATWQKLSEGVATPRESGPAETA